MNKRQGTQSRKPRHSEVTDLTEQPADSRVLGLGPGTSTVTEDPIIRAFRARPSEPIEFKLVTINFPLYLGPYNPRSLTTITAAENVALRALERYCDLQTISNTVDEFHREVKEEANPKGPYRLNASGQRVFDDGGQSTNFLLTWDQVFSYWIEPFAVNGLGYWRDTHMAKARTCKIAFARPPIEVKGTPVPLELFRSAVKRAHLRGRIEDHSNNVVLAKIFVNPNKLTGGHWANLVIQPYQGARYEHLELAIRSGESTLLEGFVVA